MGRMLSISPLKTQQIAGQDTYCDLHTLRPKKSLLKKRENNSAMGKIAIEDPYVRPVGILVHSYSLVWKCNNLKE